MLQRPNTRVSWVTVCVAVEDMPVLRPKELGEARPFSSWLRALFRGEPAGLQGPRDAPRVAAAPTRSTRRGTNAVNDVPGVGHGHLLHQGHQRIEPARQTHHK
jgi:hypothetical protein